MRVFKAFCDENRLRILEMHRTGEKCACKLLDDLHIMQSTLSHHMKILCDAGIVQGRKDGKWVYYSISPEGADCTWSSSCYWKPLVEKMRVAVIDKEAIAWDG